MVNTIRFRIIEQELEVDFCGDVYVPAIREQSRECSSLIDGSNEAVCMEPVLKQINDCAMFLLFLSIEVYFLSYPYKKTHNLLNENKMNIMLPTILTNYQLCYQLYNHYQI